MKIHQILIVIAIGLLATGCQMRTMPQDHAASLDTSDKKFNTPECKKMREEAKEFGINWAVPMLIPFGMMIEDNRRYEFLRKLQEACSSNPGPNAWDWPLRKS